jgi:hypothetical protein
MSPGRFHNETELNRIYDISKVDARPGEKPMGMLYDVTYRYPNGQLLASFDPGVSRAYVDGLIGQEGNTYAIAKNINGDGHTICIDPKGQRVPEDHLPWEIAERREAAKKRDTALLSQGFATMRKRNVHIADIRPGCAAVSIDCASPKWIELSQIEDAAMQPDIGDGLVPFYRALRHAVQHHPKYPGTR